MSLLFSILLLAPEPVVDRVPEVLQFLQASENTRAVTLLKEIGTHQKNHTEALALIKAIRSRKVRKPPEVLDAMFGALEGIGSRKATRGLQALLKHSTLKKEKAIRAGVCRALGGSADPAAVDTLIDRMRDVEDEVIAAAAKAAGNYRYAKVAIRKDLFKTVMDIYVSTWNLKNTVNPEKTTDRARAERKWEIIAQPMEKTLQLLSNATQNSPPEWRRWWNKNKRSKWQELDN